MRRRPPRSSKLMDRMEFCRDEVLPAAGSRRKSFQNGVSHLSQAPGWKSRTFVGRYRGIISVILAVARGAFTIPLGFWLKPSPLDPMGESTAIGVEDMVTNHRVAFRFRIGWRRASHTSDGAWKFEWSSAKLCNYEE